MVTSPASSRGVQVEYHGAPALRPYTVEEPAQVLLGLLVGNLQSVDLENADSIFPPESKDGGGILLPVGKAVLDAGVEPKAQFQAQFPGAVRHGSQPAGIFHGVRRPVVGIVPDVPERALGQDGVGALPALPAIVDLEHRHPQAGGAFQFCQAKAFIDLGILTPVSPGIHHDHILAGADGILPGPEGQQASAPGGSVNAQHTAIKPGPPVRTDVRRFDADSRHAEPFVVCVEVIPAIMELHIGTRCFLQEEKTARPILGKEEITPIAQFPVRDETVFKDQRVVPIRHIAELHRGAAPVLTGNRHPLQGRPIHSLGGHIGRRFDVLAVGVPVGFSGQFPQEGSPEIGVAADGRNILENPVFPAHFHRALRVVDADQQMFRPEGRSRDRLHLEPPARDVARSQHEVGLTTGCGAYYAGDPVG